MKCRVIKENNWWYGEVYGNWSMPLLNLSWTDWRKITPNCYTRTCAKLKLKKWIHENVPEEFEI